MTGSQRKVLDWLRQQRKNKSWYRPSEMKIPDYEGGSSAIGIVLGALVKSGKVEMRASIQGNGTTCREYRAVEGPEPHRKKKP
jgi:hypothetical protein